MLTPIKPTQLKLTVGNLIWLDKKVLKVDFNINEPQNFVMFPGNHLNLRISEQLGRPYSIYFNGEDSQKISIVVSVGHNGIGSNFLRSLLIGDKVTAIAPLGRFTLREPVADELIFVGTGTGVSPLMTMIHYLQKINCKSKIRIYFGVTNEDEMFFTEELKQLKNSLIDFDYYYCLSNPIKPDLKNGNTLIGRVTQQNYIINNENNTQAYICGHSKMIEEMKNKFVGLGLTLDNIFTS